MQSREYRLILWLLLGCPNMVWAQSDSSTPIMIFSGGMILLFLLLVYVIFKIRQNLHQNLDKPAK
jgi:protein-S-isoprenylcysteine O-methyltransferase Ste14